MSEYKFAIEAKHLNKTYNKKKLKPVNALVDFNIKIINFNTAFSAIYYTTNYIN